VRKPNVQKPRCPKCGKRRNLTRHHIVPVKLETGNEASIEICRECHDHIEVTIRYLEYEVLRTSQQIYWQAVNQFLRGGGS